MRKLSLAVLLSAAIHGYLLNAPSKTKEITLTNGGQTAAPSLNVVAINTSVVSKTEPDQAKPLAEKQATVEKQAALEKQPESNTVTPAPQPKATSAKSTADVSPPKPVKPEVKPQAAPQKPPQKTSKAQPMKEVKDEPQPNKSLSTTTKQTKPTPPQPVKETPPQPVKPTVDDQQQPEVEPLASSQVNSQPQHQQGLSQLPRLNSQPRFAQPPSAPVTHA